MKVKHLIEKVNDLEVFYREAGDPKKPTIVLLHGFPSSSHMYRDLLKRLSNEYHLIAPDYPGFGNSSMPSAEEFSYSFENLSLIVERFLNQKGINEYYLMVQDYGAPIGFRVAMRSNHKVLGIITQNGNIYEDGVNKETWAPIMSYWKEKNENIEQELIKNLFNIETMKWQYTHGTKNPDNISPENWILDYHNIKRDGQNRIQLDLFYDYQNNLKQYPKWQKLLRENEIPVLVVWGKNDAFFPEAGARGFKKDVKELSYHILDTGHFALEEEAEFISTKICEFIG